MRISLAQFGVCATLAVLAFAGGCSDMNNEVLYCDPDDDSGSWTDGAMRIDLERRLIYGGDTSSGIYPFVNGNFTGFEADFPLLLFDDSVHPSEFERDIVVEGVEFRIFPVEGSFGDLWLIKAKPRESGSEQASRQRSTVLYSFEDGVLVIGLTAFIGEKVYPVNYVPCGNRTLRYEDIRALSK
jgi:hypothetical protein